MKTRRWMLGLLVLAVGWFAAGCGDSNQEIMDKFCARWEQCFTDQVFSECYFDDVLDECDNDDELVEHFEGCLDMTCDQLSMECLMSMPSCDHSPSYNSGWLPWLPREDVEQPMPAPGGAE